MDNDRKRLVGLIIFILIIALTWVGFIVWSKFLNKGTLSVVGAAPFEVEVFPGDLFPCEESPCEIVLKSGQKDLILRKDGAKTIVTGAEISAFKITELVVDFRPEPVLSPVNKIPVSSSKKSFSLDFDAQTSRQALVDENGEVIVYFPTSISQAKIFSNDKFVFIASPEELYRVDVREKSRDAVRVEDVSIVEGKLSDNGEFFVFTNQDGELYLLDLINGQSFKLDLNVGLSQVAWIYDNRLVFVTAQSSSSTTQIGEYGSDYINILPNTQAGEYLFGIYHAGEGTYRKLAAFSELSILPSDLIATKSGSAIYFLSGEQSYKIILR